MNPLEFEKDGVIIMQFASEIPYRAPMMTRFGAWVVHIHLIKPS